MQLEISHIAMGAGGYTPTGNETALAAEVLRVPISPASYMLTPTEAMLIATFQATLGNAFNAHEVGIFVNDGATLLAVYSHPSAFSLFIPDQYSLDFRYQFGLSAMPPGVVVVQPGSVVQGPPGPSGTVGIGTVTTLAPGANAYVTNNGSPQNSILHFGIPAGQPGNQGAAGTVAIGTVTTGAPGSSVSVQNVGTPQNAILNIAIPRGNAGTNGAQGLRGPGVIGAHYWDGTGYRATMMFDDPAVTTAGSGTVAVNGNTPVAGTHALAFGSGNEYVLTSAPINESWLNVNGWNLLTYYITGGPAISARWFSKSQANVDSGGPGEGGGPL